MPCPPLRPSRCSQRGQSLIEVTFATAVVSLVLVAILSSVIQSVQNSRVALEQTRTTNFAQEAIEWIRSERDVIGWGVLHSAVNSRAGDVTYCVPTLPDTFDELLTSQSGECETDEKIPDTEFRRSLQFEVLSATQVEVTARVTRPGSSGEVTTTLNTILADFE